MIASDLMSTPAFTCRLHSDLSGVTRIMVDRDCGFVPIVDETGVVVGVLTDRDICVATAALRQLPERISAAQAMAMPVHASMPGDSIDDVLATMREFQVRRLPIVDGQGRPVGVIALSDIVRASHRGYEPQAAKVVSALAEICAHRAIESAA